MLPCCRNLSRIERPPNSAKRQISTERARTYIHVSERTWSTVSVKTKYRSRARSARRKAQGRLENALMQQHSGIRVARSRRASELPRWSITQDHGRVDPTIHFSAIVSRSEVNPVLKKAQPQIAPHGSSQWSMVLPG